MAGRHSAAMASLLSAASGWQAILGRSGAARPVQSGPLHGTTRVSLAPRRRSPGRRLDSKQRMGLIMPRRTAPRLESTSREASPNTPFGISRSPSQRIELVFALRNGGMLAVTHDMGAPVSAETLDKFCAELRQ